LIGESGGGWSAIGRSQAGDQQETRDRGCSDRGVG